MSVCTCSVDSGRTAGTRPIKCRSVAPGVGKTEAPATGLSKLNSMAFRLAVYASPVGLPTYDARLASGRWSSTTGRALHPQDSYERFQICILTSLPPLPSLLGAIRHTGVLLVDVTDAVSTLHNAAPGGRIDAVWQITSEGQSFGLTQIRAMF